MARRRCVPQAIGDEYLVRYASGQRCWIIEALYAIVIHMANANTTVLSVRVSPAERAILEAAAEQAHTSLSDFMRRKALEAAEVEVLNRTIVTIPAKDWEAFEAWINRPAETIPALAKLAKVTPPWKR